MDILAQQKNNLIISDMRMPEMNGYQLFKQVRKKYPSTMRVILSGYADEKEIISALQDGSTRMYITKGNNQQNKFLTNEILWKHASLTNKIVHLIYERLLKKKLPSISSTAGLLHDIGKVILLKNFPEQYKQVTDQIRGHHTAITCDIENQILKVSHQEIGGFLLNWWGMPQPIVEAAVFHHIPFDKRVIEKELVGAVHIADYYSWQRINNGILPVLDQDIFSALGIKQEDCEEMIKEIKADE